MPSCREQKQLLQLLCQPIQHRNIIIIMNCLLLFLLLFAPAHFLSAQLKLTDYEPLIFQLSFSFPVQKPTFQLLYNNIYDIPYTFITNSEPSDRFLMQANIGDLPSTSQLESYDLLFNNPLTVGGGDLQINSYTLHAQKTNIQIVFPSALGIFLLICAYFFNMFTEIGKLAIEFMQIYTLYMFHNDMATTIYRQLYQGLLLIPPSNILDEESYSVKDYIMACLIVPLSIIWSLALVGYAFKKLSPPAKDRSIFFNIMYEEFTFNAFIKSTRLFLFNLIFNSIQFIVLVNKGYPPITDIYSSGIVLLYFNLITLLAIIYLKLYILNPKIGQKQESWQMYVKQEQFNDFRVFHAKTNLAVWYKRNYSLFNSIRIATIVSFFFWNPIYQYMVLLVQFLHIFYCFTVQPFKQEFYINVNVICRLLFLSEYIFIVLGNLYYSIGAITFNYFTAYTFIMARDSLFLVIVFGFFIAVFFQIYFNCINLNYHIKVVREANQLKLQFVEKIRTQSESKDFKSKNLSMAISDKRSKSQSRQYDSLSDVGVASSPRKTRKKSSAKREEDSNLLKKDSSDLQRQKEEVKSGRDIRNKKVEIQMADMKMVDEAFSSDAASKKRKWKKQSLLEGMLHKQQ